jgi:hypothetical protein
MAETNLHTVARIQVAYIGKSLHDPHYESFKGLTILGEFNVAA